MTTTILRIFRTLLVLGVLTVIVPGVWADEDRVAETGAYQAQLFQDTVNEYADLRNFAGEMNSLRQNADQAWAPSADVSNEGAAQPPAPAPMPVVRPQILTFPAQKAP